ncbi:MAG: CPBP family intramembrane glutamic endopeptidase [Candidatus Hodarchaeales archaeon]|jgi:membrane protease YdiL (CAAX protease family)
MLNNEKTKTEENNGINNSIILPALSLGIAMTLFFLLEAGLIQGLLQIESFLLLDSIIQNILVLLITQLIGVVIVFYIFLPFFKIKYSDFQPFSRSSIRTTIILFFLSLGSTFLAGLLLTTVFAALGWIMKLGYSEITITAEHISNPSYLILFLIATTIGAPLFEEMVYRRMLIPLLEECQVSPFIAVVESSIMFAMAHLNDNLMYGNIAGGIYQTIGVFILAMMLGMTYIMTRNIIYPVVLHAFTNLIGSLNIIFTIEENYFLLTIFSILVLIMLVIGIGISLYLLGKYIHGKETDWIKIIKKRSEVKVSGRLTRFMVVGSTLVLLPTVIKITFPVLNANSNLSGILSIVSHTIIFVVLLWFVAQKRGIRNIIRF